MSHGLWSSKSMLFLPAMFMLMSDLYPIIVYALLADSMNPCHLKTNHSLVKFSLHEELVLHGPFASHLLPLSILPQEISYPKQLKVTQAKERISNVAYNIVNGLCTPIRDQSAPIYITIGDGGNLEGLVTSMTEPQPSYSAFREPSFGHGILDIKNRTHAYFSWHRNQDGYAVEADSVWLHNRFWNPMRASSVAAL
ncbi:LOW QUALITY PROTEIN: hypothetical protein NC651_014377 [Populus alba x Populus x berolinensis]|nr:LOW QUALITY PROTEIN: hypothetical protein NC651_014377 [Populus alba x Populus x berolinensis]